MSVYISFIDEIFVVSKFIYEILFFFLFQTVKNYIPALVIKRYSKI